MARLTGPTSEGVSALLPYFNNLLGAVQAGGTTSQLWDAYRSAVELAGGALGNPSIYDMNYVAGHARAVNNAQVSLGAAAATDALDSSMWAWAPWSAGDTAAWLTDRYQLRYQAVLQGEGGPQTVWGVTDWEGTLEGLSKQDILDRSLQSAQESLDSGSPRVIAQLGMAEGFSVSHIGAVQIMRI